MNNPRWLGVLACLITLAGGVAAAADPPQAEEGQAEETASEAQVSDPGTQATSPDPETSSPAPAGAPETQAADPDDPELAGSGPQAGAPSQPEAGSSDPEAPVAGAQEAPAEDPPADTQVRAAGAAMQVVNPILPKPAQNAPQRASAGTQEKPAAPKGAVPSPEESLQIGEALDDLLLFPEPYYYESLGRRDIFVSLLPDEEEVDPNLRSEDLTVVGILWAEHDRFALVEAPDRRCMILREGAQLGDGTVIRILPDRVIVHVTEYGTSRNVSLPLAEGGITDENPRSRTR